MPPSGLVAGAPLVLSLPWLARLLREQGRLERVTAVLLAGAAATVLVPVGFADASLGEVLDATATHTWYYLSFSWREELVHYDYLLRLADTGVWGRRAPVLLTLSVLLLVAIGSARRAGTGDPTRRLLVQAGSPATTVRSASRIHPAGPPTRPWGQVEHLVYDHPIGLVDLRVQRAAEAGWHRDTPVTGEAYSGRRDSG
ncbi:MAG: arabinosyltransferase domain-containing protein [Actinomycetota bacterium]|nr:arabinosyltransferase domain-containing protein [Actinomycetota bacterium]